MRVGVNLPWATYGGDFGANAWHPHGGLLTREVHALAATLDSIAAAGLSLVRWFVLCDGRAGVRFAADGTPLGLDDHLVADLDFALELVGRAGLQLVPVLFDFHWCRPGRIEGAVQLGGRAPSVRDPLARAALVSRVVGPLAARYADEPTIAAWDLFNEPEWITLGYGTWNPLASVDAADLRALLGDVAALIHGVGSRPVTVGLASAAGFPLVAGLDLDILQVHWYDRFDGVAPLERPVHAFDRPVWLGEFPSRGSSRTVGHLLDTAAQAGYAAAMAWSALGTDDVSDGAAALERTAAWLAGRSTDELN